MSSQVSTPIDDTQRLNNAMAGLRCAQSKILLAEPGLQSRLQRPKVL